MGFAYGVQKGANPPFGRSPEPSAKAPKDGSFKPFLAVKIYGHMLLQTTMK